MSSVVDNRIPSVDSTAPTDVITLHGSPEHDPHHADAALPFPHLTR